MTIKKSLISVSAAALLVAGMAGCSSSDSNSTPTPTPTPTTVTSITATDGYVLNYTATAIVSDGNESNNSYATVALPNAVKYATIAAGSEQVAGSPVLDLTKDLTASQISNLIRVEIAHRAQSSDGTTLTYGTFFDSNGDNKFVAADGDVLAGSSFALSTPKGYKNITPVTSLIAARIATLMTGESNDSNRSALEAKALAEIAAGLGIAADSIKNIDPMDAVSSNPEYTLINSMLGQSVTDGDLSAIATSLSSATAATDAPSALRNIAAGATGSAAFYTSAADQFAADPDMINNVASMNLDATRNVSAAQISFTPISSKAGSSDFNVTKITLGAAGTSSTDTLLASGAKINLTDLGSTRLTLSTAADVNITNKPITLAVSIGAQQAYKLGDANISSLTFLVPMDLNSTLGTENAQVSGDVTWEGIKADGSTFSGDMNASTFNTKVAAAATVAPVTFPSAGIMNLNVGGMISVIDTNSSNAAGIVDSLISDVKIALVDTNSTLQTVNTAGKSTYWGNTKVAAVGGTINVTGKSIFKNANTDARAGAAATPNAAPTISAIVAKSADMNASDTNASLAVSRAVTNKMIIVTKGAGIVALDLNGTSVDETGEENSTVVINNLPSWVTGVTTKVLGSNSASADFNLSVDGNASITTETTTVANMQITDEFDYAVAETDNNITFFFNQYPVIGTLATKEMNMTNPAVYANVITLHNDADDCSIEQNSTSGTTYTCSVSIDGNLTITPDANETTAETVEVNATVKDAYGAATTKTVLLQVSGS